MTTRTQESTNNIEYLTVHDLAWINTIVTGQVNSYNYFDLESVMAGQYSYGDSHNVLKQAAEMLQRSLDKKPFSEGNRPSSLVALLTFLNANGYATKANERMLATLFGAAERGDKSALEVVKELATPAQSSLPAGLTLRKLIIHECNHHVEALKLLA